jgi:hypothetical protein
VVLGIARTGRIVALVVALISAAVPASADAHERVKRVVRVVHGQLAPDGVAELSGALPARLKPGSYALSKSARFDKAAVTLGFAAAKARRGTFDAWLAIPDAVSRGAYQLLACRGKRPSKSGCVAVGTVSVGAAPTIRAATPTLDSAHAASGSADIVNGGTVTATAADGTMFILTVPNHGIEYTPITMTPVTSLAPASAVGRLVDGVQIDPAGEAPPGATLEIRHAGGYPAGARTVAFGAGDPSGGAYPILTPPSADITIPIAYFAGYGVTVPASKSADTRPARSVPCEARAVTAAAGSRPLISCTSAPDLTAALVDAFARGDTAALELAYQAGEQQVAAEMARIEAQPPTDEGAAELEVLSTVGLSIERQVQLMGLETGNGITAELANAFTYQYNLIKSKCLRPGSSPSDIYVSYYIDAFELARQGNLIDGAVPSDLDSVASSCFQRIKLQLAGNLDGQTDTGQWTGHAVVSGTATIKGAAGLTLVVDPQQAPLTFTSASAQADPAFAAPPINGTATVTSTGGFFQPQQPGIWATRRVRCDKNHHFVVERHTYLLVKPGGMWADKEQIQIAVNGNNAGPPEDASHASNAWANDYGLGSTTPRLQLEIGGAPFEKSDSGKCSGVTECTTFSFTASLAATALVN